MRIGPLRHRVIVEKQTQPVGRASDGAELPAWTTHATVWADVRPMEGGSEVFVQAADQRHALARHKVTMRYRTDLSVKMRVLWGVRPLDIEQIQDPSGKREFTVLVCREVQP